MIGNIFHRDIFYKVLKSIIFAFTKYWLSIFFTYIFFGITIYRIFLFILELKETRRQKRKVSFEESDSDSIYACVKVVVGRQAYRSCVPKYSGYVNVTCTSTLGRSVVCYCETDECNKASFLDVFFRPWILILALLFVTLI